MKYKITIFIVLFSLVIRTNAQTRYYSLAYSRIPVELSGIAEEAVYGGFGLKLSTFKYKTCRWMSGYTFSYNQLSAEETSRIRYATDIFYNYIYGDLVRKLSVQKFSFSYNYLWHSRKKEIDDAGSMFGIVSYYFAYNHVNEDFSSPNIPEQKLEKYLQNVQDQSSGGGTYSPVDFGVKLGLGYQRRIGKQWMVYGDIETYLSMAGSVGYEYGIGVRYRGLGKH